jgi:type IV secretion system protein VirD4
MSIWAVNGGIGLGIGVDGKPLPYVGDRHICLIGPNGTGKTKRLLVPVLAENTGWTCIVADIKGELCAMTAHHRRRAGNRIIRLNPFNVLGLGSDGFRPHSLVAAHQRIFRRSDAVG